jgi:uncharacterized membrane protein YccC
MEYEQELRPQSHEESSLQESAERDDVISTIRTGMKHQIKSMRDLQSTMDQGFLQLARKLDRWEGAKETSDSEPRKMAKSLAEIEESLDRAISSLSRSDSESNSSSPADFVSSEIQRLCDSYPRWKRWAIKPFVAQIHELVQRLRPKFQEAVQRERTQHSNTKKGLELLLQRVHRLMQSHSVERVDVVGMPFDAERMRAIEVIESPDVQSSHVAEQLRPLYLWNSSILCVADVKLAR